ncbi:MAG: DegT/DnrJ/EryC1/StrS family aminotransferase [Verrucomicrobiota bacterium]
MEVPLINLKAHHAPLKDELAAAIEEVIEASAFSGGPFVNSFEEDFARYCGVDHAVGVGNGTDALWLALLALGVGPGDEVITVPMTFIATAEAISRTGARPVFVDIDEASYTMDSNALEQAVTARTKVILPVHLFGQMADMEPILAIARKHGLHVVEDAAQAHGATYQGSRAGSVGQAGCFSFYPGKNLGAFGEAGAVTTNDALIAKKIRVFRDHGQSCKYQHSVVGWNCRMDGIQAAVLRVKLRELDLNNAKRREIAVRYSRAFQEIPQIILPFSTSTGSHAHHQYVVRVPDRKGFMDGLSSKSIASAIHYPIPVHLQDAYLDLGHGPGSFPVAERCAKEFVSLPMYPELTPSQVGAVIEAVGEVLEIGMPA